MSDRSTGGCTVGARSYFRRGVLGAAMLLVAAATDRVSAQNDQSEFDIPPQALASALRQFADQDSLQLVFSPSIVEGLETDGLKGKFSREQALEKLIEGTGLTFSYDGKETVVVRRSASQDQSSVDQNGGLARQVAQVIQGDRQTDASLSTQTVHGVDEIIVTALKRSQSLQDVPVSVQAFSKRMLEERGAREFADFLHGVASLSYDERGPGRSSFVIRGVSPVSGVATVGIYIDDMPATDSRYQPEINMLDVERVEILRGPQGTLYGEGSMGGIIRVITSRPDPSTYEVATDMTFSATKNGGANAAIGGMVNIPIVEDRFAVRISGFLDETDGWIDNVAPGQEEDGVNDKRLFGGRISALWNVTDRLQLAGMYMYQDIDLDGISYTSPEVGDLEQRIFVDEGSQDRLHQVNLTLDYDFSWAQLSASTSYLNRVHFEQNERSWIFFPSIIPTLGKNDVDLWVFSEEIRLTSNPGRLQWLAGLFVKLARDDELRFLGIDLFGGTVFDQTLGNKSDKGAVFGEVSYNFTDSLQATIGLRYFREKLGLSELTAASPVFGIPETLKSQEGTFSKLTSKFILSYRTGSDLLFYASASEGFRSGGFNVSLQDPSLPNEFDPDSAWNYEVGFKGTWADGRFTVNAAVFYIDWSNMQILVRDPETLIVFTDNAGNARSRGGELEVVAIPLQGLELSFSGSYNDSELTEDSLLAPAGTPLAAVPEYNLSASAQYRFRINDELNGLFRADFTYVGDSFFSVEAFQRELQEAYSLGNLKAGIEGSNWQAFLFVKNVWDERADLTVFPGNAMVDFGGEIYRNQPRTVGINVRLKL